MNPVVICCHISASNMINKPYNSTYTIYKKKSALMRDNTIWLIKIQVIEEYK